MDKTLVKFNIQNAAYALLQDDGTFGTPVKFATSRNISLEPDQSSKTVYGDGKKIVVFTHDKGKTVTLGTNNITDAFEIAMGRKIVTANGIAEIKQRKTPVFALYFETCGVDGDNNYPIAKTWVYGCTSATRPTESYDQTEDDINESSFEYSFDVSGTDVLKADGTTVYTDDNGNEVVAWQQTCEPEDEGYSTFGDAVVLPVMSE